VNLFARMIRCSPIVPVIGDGRTKLQPVPVKSVAAAAVKSLTDPRVIGETYELCGPEALTFDEVLDAIMAVLGRRRVKWHMPWGLARAQARCLEFVFGTMFRSASPLSRDQIVMLREDNVGDPTVADVVFGLHAPGFREGIGAYLKR
jgi:NADH dehydrogenase